MPITQFTRETCKELQHEVKEALDVIGKKHGITIGIGNGRFSNSFLNFKVEFSMVSKDGIVMDKSAVIFNRSCQEFNLQPEDLGRMFLYQGKKFKLIGMAPRSINLPFYGMNTKTGKKFKFSAGIVKSGLQLERDIQG